MRNEWISQFIDDELDLEEKVGFVKAVHGDADYFADTVALLDQERWLRSPMVAATDLPELPEINHPVRRTGNRWLIPLAAAAVLIAAVVIGTQRLEMPVKTSAPVPYRFVIHCPTASAVTITGSFTQWKQVALKPTGDTGYWEIVLPLNHGEHRFSYIIGGSERIPDPTIPTREPDDFGGVNTVLEL